MGCKVAFLEALVVFLALWLVAYTGGAHATDYLASTAVFLGFIYSQMSFDLADAHPMHSTENPCAKMKNVYLLKEATWILTFGLLGSWPLFVGAIMFISYPMIRSLTRGKPGKTRNGSNKIEDVQRRISIEEISHAKQDLKFSYGFSMPANTEDLQADEHEQRSAQFSFRAEKSKSVDRFSSSLDDRRAA